MTRSVFGWAVLGLLATACATPATPVAKETPKPVHSGFVRSTAVPRPRLTPSFPAYSATANIASVAVHTLPGGPVKATLANPQPSGAPLVFLVTTQRAGWVQVQLPIRPNGSTGWVRARDVRLTGLSYRLEVRRAAHRLAVFRFGRLEHTYPVGIGTTDTPTPGGTFYLKELLKPPNPGGAYGPYAYGLSGFSNQLTSFAGGDGVIGIHGTDHPELVGTDVSHGCIRLRNADIIALAKRLPLGTPVTILA